MHIAQRDCAKLFCQPVCSRAFAKWRSRNSRHLQLPAGKLRFLIGEPFHGRAHFRGRSQALDFLLNDGKWFNSGGARGRAHGQVVILQPKAAQKSKPESLAYERRNRRKPGFQTWGPSFEVATTGALSSHLTLG